MSVISRVTTWSDGQTLTASALNGEINNILSDYNGSITNANISATAAIALSKLATTPATLTGTEVLTNKTINGASNTLTVREADLSISDNTTKDVSTSAHGFVPKAPNDTTKFLRGDGTWTITPTAITSKVVAYTRDLSAAAGSQTLTGAGFTPTSVTVIAELDSNAAMSMGFADSTGTGRAVAQTSAGTMASTSGIVYISPSGGTDNVATISSYNSDGMVVAWTKNGAPTGTINFYVIYYK